MKKSSARLHRTLLFSGEATSYLFFLFFVALFLRCDFFAAFLFFFAIQIMG